MTEFNKLFNVFTVAAVIILLATTVAAGSLAVIKRGKSNIFSPSTVQNRVEITENYVTKL